MSVPLLNMNNFLGIVSKGKKDETETENKFQFDQISGPFYVHIQSHLEQLEEPEGV